MKNRISKSSNGFLSGAELKYVARVHKVKNKIVSDMESRLSLGDQSLNEKYNNDTEHDFLSSLPDDSPNPEDIISAMRDNESRKKWLFSALKSLDQREQTVVSRKLYDKTLTLDTIARKIGVSKERVRQIETKAYSKLKKQLIHISKQKSDFFIKTN